ncbi:Transcriptional activator protein CzcR [Novipirellula aureliae]|uniref:Transcriptional activator protein CzcR n=1 Tax=Novipirellula aureliae TaxID=2527966 RepID=A0A5C6DX61_9BACT|nr:response regulator [Novipirellula aureliae]TWU41222.1 Transcriptional activator protein CzcR [Novipirellula aureliae]
MTDSKPKALVADDEVLVRNLTMRALSQVGFECDSAADGNEALAMAECTRYDVVITDLRMPNKNGHALAIELLQREQAPRIVVLTAVLEPRLVKDLIRHGVDDVMFKPVEYPALAAKVRSLIGRSSNDDADQPPVKEKAAPVATRIVDDGLAIFRMTTLAETDADDLARVVTPNEGLAAEVLQLANSPFYNPNRTLITDLERAITQIGQKRIGQLALATNVIDTITSKESFSMDLSSVRHRCLAARFAMELLIAQGGHGNVSDGLLLCATLHELISPQCDQNVLADLLHAWGIPATLYGPLRYVNDDYETVTRLANPLRTQVELIKLAGLIGRISIKTWEPSNLIEIPSHELLERLELLSISKVIEQITRNLGGIEPFAPGSTAAITPTRHSNRVHQAQTLDYYVPGSMRFDFLAKILSSMNVVLNPCSNPASARNTVLVNSVGIKSKALLSMVGTGLESRVYVVCDRKDASDYAPFKGVLKMPTSYSMLQDLVLSG